MPSSVRCAARRVAAPDLHPDTHAVGPEGKGDLECSAEVDISTWVGDPGIARGAMRWSSAWKVVEMTRQESFKVRVRARMEKTGERYMAARRVLLEQAANAQRRRTWASEPEVSDDRVRAATGRSWDDWVDVLEAWPGADDGHPAIAAHLAAEHGLDGWWSQQVTGGFERITGRRLPFERPDGTFTAGRSKTVEVPAADLRAALLDDEARGDLFPGESTELLSEPSAKAIRISLGPGVAHFSVEDTGDGRARVSVSHRRLPAYEDVEVWQFYWVDWLAALEDA